MFKNASSVQDDGCLAITVKFEELSGLKEMLLKSKIISKLPVWVNIFTLTYGSTKILKKKCLRQYKRSTFVKIFFCCYKSATPI